MTCFEVDDNYENMDKFDLINHCRSYSASLHKIANEVSGYRLLFGTLSEAVQLARGLHGRGSGVLSVPAGMSTESGEK